MSKYIIAMIVFISYSLTNAQEWKTVMEPYVPSSFSDIKFISENEGWAAGDAGCIAHTTDGGKTWELQNSGTTKNIAKIFFLDANFGWAGTGSNTTTAVAGGTILRTTDGGKTWNEIDYSSAVPNTAFTFMDNILFLNNQVGFIVAGKSKSNYLLKTTDGGLTWAKKDSIVSTSALRWYAMDFYNESKGVIVGSAKNIQKYTTDGGETWNFSTPIVDGFFKDLRGVKYLGENEIITVGDGHEYSGVPTPVYKSTDGGVNWVKKTQSPVNSYGKTRGMYFKNNHDGIVVGNDGYSGPNIYRTSDGGETWTPQASNSITAFSALSGVGDKLYLLGYCSELMLSTDFGATWNNFPFITPSPVNDISFVGNKVYALQMYGNVMVSSDENSESWSYLSKVEKYTAKRMKFTDENTGFILHERRLIDKTTDGGKTWRQVLSPVTREEKYSPVCLAFTNSSTGYAMMNDGVESTTPIFKTTDSGESWNLSGTLAGQLDGGIYFFDENNGFIAGDNDTVNVTADGGTTWKPVHVNGVPTLLTNRDANSGAVVNSNTGFVIGNQIIFKTTDKGNSWNYIPVPDAGVDTSYNTMVFKDESVGYIGTAFTGCIYKTTDGGNNWAKYYNVGSKQSLYCSGLSKNGEVYFGLVDGTIVKYKTSAVGVEDEPVVISTYKLDQNYPNPFNPSTTFSFSIANQEKVTLKVYDILGKEVATVLNADLTAGSHSVKFDASGLSSGIYFYTLKAGNFSSTQKMILMK